jgi:hypothetical protein
MNINVPTITPDEALRTLLSLYQMRHKANGCGMLWGASGIGKSTIAKDLAKAIGGRLVLYRLGGKLPEDLRGIPQVNAETGTTRWYHDEELPTNGAGVLFLDEINTARPEVMNQGMEVMLERSLGRWRCPDDFFVLGAGNEAAHGASVFDMPIPVADKAYHIKVGSDFASWSTGWAMRNEIAPEILAFLQVRSDLFDCGERRVTSDHMVDASPRGWEAVSNVFKEVPPGRTRDILIAGKVGGSIQSDLQDVLRQLQDYASVDRLMVLKGDKRIAAMPGTLHGLNALAYGLAYSTKDVSTAQEAYDVVSDILHVKADDALPLAELSRLAHELVTAKVEHLGLTVKLIRSAEYRGSKAAWDEIKRAEKAG